jgi:outer membrane protein TolC
MEQLLVVSNQKLTLVNTRADVGMADAVARLQTESDYNSALQQFDLQKLTIKQAKTDLALLLNLKPEQDLIISDTIIADSTLIWSEILENLFKNPEYQIAQSNVSVKEQLVKETAAQRYPSIKLSAGYDFYQTNFNAGNQRLVRNSGPAIGLNLAMPVYNGNQLKTLLEVARINAANAKIYEQSTKTSLEIKALKLYSTYTTLLQQIRIQQTNYQLASDLLFVVMQKYQVNQATVLEAKTAQASFENAAYMLTNLSYSALAAEVELKKMIFKLQN